jgi:hypothetical protein
MWERRQESMPERTEQPIVSSERLMLAYLCIKDAKGLTAQVQILDRFGLSDADIARVCDVVVGSVANARLSAKRLVKGLKNPKDVAKQIPIETRTQREA